MFVDSSALVAILTDEPEREDFLRKLEGAAYRVTSAIVVYETSHALSRKGGLELAQAREKVEVFVRNAAVDVVPIGDPAGKAAVDASARYGKGSGHPARLNMGDCFSYAMAKELKVPLLYKGDDFARTDLA